MTRPREDRRRDYREPPSRYRPSEDRRSPSNYQPERYYSMEAEKHNSCRNQQRRSLMIQEYSRLYEEPRRVSHREVRRHYDGSRQPVRNSTSFDNFNERNYDRRPLRTYSNNQKNRYSLDQAKKQTNRKIFVFLHNLIFYTVTIGLLMAAIMFAFSSNNNASILGYRFYNVLTSSMKPSEDSPPGGFDAGAITIVKMIDGSEAKEGDIVTYAVGNEGSYLTHRLIERVGKIDGKEGNYVITKGDANRSSDPPINEERIMGKVLFAIPKAGIVIEFIRAQFWPCLVCMLSIFGCFIVLKAYLFSDEEMKQTNRKHMQQV